MIRYIYKITCLQGSLKDHYYIGQHSTEDMNDNYPGSGNIIRRYYVKYGRIEGETYTKEILAYANDIDELNDLEEQYIGDKFKTDPLCLNLRSGGKHYEMGESTKQILSELAKKQMSDPDMKKRIDEARSLTMSSEEYKLKASKAQKQRFQRPEEKIKVSNNSKEFWTRPGYRENQIAKRKIIFSGRKWINNGTESKFVKPSDLDKYLSEGWKIGMSYSVREKMSRAKRK